MSVNHAKRKISHEQNMNIGPMHPEFVAAPRIDVVARNALSSYRRYRAGNRGALRLFGCAMIGKPAVVGR
jgi:hypothetical protein